MSGELLQHGSNMEDRKTGHAVPVKNPGNLFALWARCNRVGEILVAIRARAAFQVVLNGLRQVSAGFGRFGHPWTVSANLGSTHRFRQVSVGGFRQHSRAVVFGGPVGLILLRNLSCERDRPASFWPKLPSNQRVFQVDSRSENSRRSLRATCPRPIRSAAPCTCCEHPHRRTCS